MFTIAAAKKKNDRIVRLGKTESALVRSLERDSLLVERGERLMTIPAVGPITALTWALEIGDVRRFFLDQKSHQLLRAVRGREEFGEHRAAHAAIKATQQAFADDADRSTKMAPRNSPELAMLYDKEKQKGNANRATLAVARKLVPNSWRSTVDSAIFRWWRGTASLRRSAAVNKEDFFDAWPARSCR
jgi:transposase